VAHKLARMLFLLSLAAIGLGLVAESRTGKAAPPAAETRAAERERIVFLGGDLGEESLIAFTANVAASAHPGVVLLDTPKFSKYTKNFLDAYQADRVIPVGEFPDGLPDLKQRLGVSAAKPIGWQHAPPTAFWNTLFPHAERVVVCPAEPRRLLLQAACLAGALQAPLFVAHGAADEGNRLRHQLADWKTQEVFVVGGYQIPRHLPNVRLVRLADEEAVSAAYLRRQLVNGPIQTLVIANPADTRKGMGTMSCLAPWLALQHHALLLLTNDEGDNTPALVANVLKHPRLRTVENILLAADLRAIPMERRPNPIAGKDAFIEMEPLTPTGTAPFSFATGRLFHAEPGVGYETTSLFGNDVTKNDVRRRLPECDIFLWEGHHSTLIKDYGFADWTEPLPPSFVFLQSCLALAEAKAGPLLQRGSVGVVGSSTRIYSGSGGAFTLAFFNALLYDGQPVGASLRQAKNFLLAYSLLKEKRLGKDAKLGGANLRSAWAFTLWGDPTLQLPAPAAPDALAGVQHEVHGHSIIIKLPDTSYEKVTNGEFRAQMRPNARLAGLLRKDDDSGRHMVPFVFAEVHMPKAPANQTPRLRTRLPEANWVFCWDERRRCGYLLVTPRPRDERELRFHVEWESQVQGPEPEAASGTEP
jgi:hypothetical protein